VPLSIQEVYKRTQKQKRQKENKRNKKKKHPQRPNHNRNPKTPQQKLKNPQQYYISKSPLAFAPSRTKTPKIIIDIALKVL